MNHDLPAKAFQTFTDPEQMKVVFQAHLPQFSQGNLLVAQCEILHTHYKIYLDEASRHRSFFVACYRLSVVESHRQQGGEQLLCARAYLNGRSARKFRNVDHRHLYPPRFGVPVVHLPALDMIVWAFPNDSDLHHLPAIVDPQQLRRYLPFQALSGDTVDPHPGTDATPDVAMEIVRYKPGKRCTIRYDVCWETGGRKRQWQIFGKMVAGEKGSETYQQMMNLWHRSHVQPDAFGVAQPLGHHAEIRMTWQAALPGVPLSEAMASTHAETLIEAAGKGLADLHRSALVPSARQGIADHLAAAQAETAELAKAYPQFTGVLQTLVTGIEQRMPVLPPDQERPIHRDFHVNQLLVHEGRLFIFDFDDFSMGDPMQDLAFFIVDLHYRDLEPDRVNQIAVAIYQAYQAAADWPAPRERLNWHIQVQFLAKAYWLFKKRQFKAEIGQAIVRTLTLAQQNIMGKAPNGEMR